MTSSKIPDKNEVVKGAKKILVGPSIRLYYLNLKYSYNRYINNNNNNNNHHHHHHHHNNNNNNHNYNNNFKKDTLKWTMKKRRTGRK